MTQQEKYKKIFADDPEMLAFLEAQEQKEIIKEILVNGKVERGVKMQGISYLLKGDKGDKGDVGDVGKTPVLGVDYLTPEEVQTIRDELRPVKGEDYFDGESADEDEIVARVLSQVPSKEEILSEIKLPENKIDEDALIKRVLGKVPKISIPTVDDFVKEIKKGKLLELRDIRGARLDMNDQRYHGGGITNILNGGVLVTNAATALNFAGIDLTGVTVDTLGVVTVTISSASLSPLTTKGDIWGYSTTNARIPVGSNAQVLTADSTQALGVKWATPAATTLAAVSSVSTDATKSLYQMTTGVPVEFRASDATTVLKIDETNKQLLTGSGSAAHVSYGFTANAGSGMFLPNPNQLGFSANSTPVMTLVRGSGENQWAHPTTVGTYFGLFDTGALELVAGGSNQNITLTPSGSGTVNQVSTQAGDVAFLGYYNTSTLGFVLQRTSGLVTIDARNTGDGMVFRVNGTSTGIKIASSTNTLLGGLLTDGTGVLQFPAATTSAGGITFGTDLNVFRGGAGSLAINHPGASNPEIWFQESGTNKAYIETFSGELRLGTAVAGNATVIKSGSYVTALTLDSSQNATFAGTVFTGANGRFGFTGRSQIGSSADGVLTLFDNAQTTFGRLTFGGTTSSFPAIKRSSAILAFRLADDSADAAVTMSTASLSGKIPTYNNITTAGWGVPAIYGAGRATAQTAANTSVSTYTVGAADGSFEVSANVLVTTSSAENFTVTCSYTDEGNTARVLTLNFQTIAAVIGTAINFANGAVPYEGLVVHIRAKASTTITIKTVGTFTGCTYNCEGIIKQTA